MTTNHPTAGERHPSIVRKPGGFVLPAGLGAGRGAVEDLAEWISLRLDLGSGMPLSPFLERHGVRTIGFAPGIDGAVLDVKGRSFTFGFPTCATEMTRHLHLAQALGHVVLHLPQARRTHADLPFRAPYVTDENDESSVVAHREAIWFAWAFLMPRTTFSQVWSTHEGNAARTAETFGVPENHATLRARRLGLLEEPERTAGDALAA